MPERPGGKPMPVGGSGATYNRTPSQGGHHPPERPVSSGGGNTNLGPNVNRDLMTKQQRKQFESQHGLGKVGLPNWGIVGTLAKEYDIRKTHGKTSEKTEHKGLRQDLRTGAYYHKAPKYRPISDRGVYAQRTGNGEGGASPVTAATSAQATQPIKPAMKPYYMGFDFQQAKHKLGNPTGQLMPDPSKRLTKDGNLKKEDCPEANDLALLLKKDLIHTVNVHLDLMAFVELVPLKKVVE